MFSVFDASLLDLNFLSPQEHSRPKFQFLPSNPYEITKKPIGVSISSSSVTFMYLYVSYQTANSLKGNVTDGMLAIIQYTLLLSDILIQKFPATFIQICFCVCIHFTYLFQLFSVRSLISVANYFFIVKNIDIILIFQSSKLNYRHAICYSFFQDGVFAIPDN